ncbi:hypothetical protein [Priestia endophytica]|uniref:hypothetical protein n=1 Tax=Priestia endophytica TaxID=135735 RepID=UPI00124D5D57|nr:hypothetical protein [Priestia endophytica]KAB2489628.1 hypothetical protein F8155_23110 [Priestia endophytica]
MISSGSVLEVVAGSLIVSVLGAWFLLSIAYYYPPLGKWIGRYDHLLLIPQWSFFAPIPNRADYYLFVRCSRGKDRSLSMWKEVRLANERSWAGFVWNPDRRIRKGFFDLTSELCSMVDIPREEILVSLPYLHLLTVATATIEEGADVEVQFAVGRVLPAESETDVTVLFCSEFHSISERPGKVLKGGDIPCQSQRTLESY